MAKLWLNFNVQNLTELEPVRGMMTVTYTATKAFESNRSKQFENVSYYLKSFDIDKDMYITDYINREIHAYCRVIDKRRWQKVRATLISLPMIVKYPLPPTHPSSDVVQVLGAEYQSDRIQPDGYRQVATQKCTS